MAGMPHAALARTAPRDVAQETLWPPPRFFAPGDYKEVILFLTTAGVVVPLFHRLKVSPVLGFIGAGAMLGPYGLGRMVESVPWLGWITIANRSEIDHLAEFGIVFLLFMIGIELSFERLRTLRRLVFGLGLLQVVACTAAIAILGYVFGLAPAAAIVTGIALALSSTAIVVPVLAEQKRLGSPAGRASFSVLLFQDLAVPPVLFTIVVTGSQEGTSVGAALGLALLQAAGALVIIVAVGASRLAPAVPHGGGDQEPRIVHGRMPARGAGNQRRGGAQRPVDGARRLHRGPASGGNGVPARHRSHDRAVQGPLAGGSSSCRSAWRSISTSW